MYILHGMQKSFHNERREQGMNKLREILSGREVAIAGIGKYQQDFEYVFEEVRPIMYIVEDGSTDLHNGRRVVPVEEVRELELDNLLIIICDALESEIEKRLRGAGLEGYGKNYIWAEELFEALDFNLSDTVGERKVVFWNYCTDLKAKYDEIEALQGIEPYMITGAQQRKY